MEFWLYFSYPSQKRFKIRRKTYSLLATRSCLVIILLHYYFSYRFCPEDFSETVRWIFVKFSGVIVSYKNLIYFFLFWWRHFRFWNIVIFLIFRGSSCLSYSSLTNRDIWFKFSGMIEDKLRTTLGHFRLCSSKSAEAR